MKFKEGDILYTKDDINSGCDPLHLHKAGSAVRVVVALSDKALLGEIKVYDPNLEGDAWYETIEFWADELSKDNVSK